MEASIPSNDLPLNEDAVPPTSLDLPTMKGLLGQVEEASGSLGDTFGELQDLTMQVALHGEPRMTEEINKLLEQMETQERMHREGIAEIHLILNDYLEKQFLNHLEAQAQQGIDREIDELVREQVASYLEVHIPQDLQDEVGRTQRELEDLGIQLHNSESRRANALLRSNHPDDSIHAVYMSNGEVSSHFPKTLRDLFNLNEMCKTLAFDYELPVSDARDHNLNLFMQFCGVTYQVVCSSG